jgi:hypothetical protein
VEALRILEVCETEWTLKEYSNCRKKKGIWMGDVGRSELKIVTRVDNGSVRDMFGHDAATSEEPELEITPDAKNDD